MFKLQPNPTFWTKVEIHRPGEGLAVLELEFRHMGTTAALDLATEVSGPVSRERRMEILGQLIAGWRGVDTEFSAPALREIAEHYPAFAPQVISTYLEELRGARRKN